ncbi:MAG: ABC transporter permease [Bacteroidales bacterium]
MSLSSLIAFRWLKPKPNAYTSPMIRLGIASVALCVFVMVISLCVLVGFKKEISQKVFGFGAHISIRTYQTESSREAQILPLAPSFYHWLENTKEIKQYQVFASKGGLLKTADENYGIVAKGVAYNYDTVFFSSKLIAGRLARYHKDSSSNEILISKEMAKKLQIRVGEKARCYFVVDDNLRERAFKVVGIYETGLEKFDKSIIICDLKQIQKLNNWQDTDIEGVEVELVNPAQINHISLRINDLLPYDCIAYNVYELYPDIFGWLDLTDMNVLILFIIMSLVSSISLISILFILVIEQSAGVGILKALGASNRLIEGIFIKQSMGIMGIGLLIGNILSLLVCGLQNAYHFLKLDQSVYFLSHIPVSFPWEEILLLNLAFVVISGAFIGLASFIVNSLSPIEALKLGNSK